MILAGAAWFCLATEPEAAQDPVDLDELDGEWLVASVPGTAAGALRDAGAWTWGHEDEAQLDGRDWWWRCRFAGPAAESGPWDLELGGLATLADVWLNGQHVLRSENMFVSQRVGVERLDDQNELTIRCAALEPVLRRRHPRPRFKSRLVRHQSLRWYRTTLLGRMPGWSRWAAPVGPWRPVSLGSRPPHGVLGGVSVRTACDAAGGGTVTVSATLTHGRRSPSIARLSVGHSSAEAEIVSSGDGTVALSGEVTLPHVERWWPHNHGSQHLYPVSLELDGERRELRRVGFRTIKLDDSDDGFALIVNGLRCFCRGVTWGPGDAVSMVVPDEQLSSTLCLARDAGINMIRLGGFGVYEDARFWNLCDELGIMVWQDCMIASVDPPADGAFVSSLATELRQQFAALGGRPALTVACGSSETYQQGSLYGFAPERYRSELLERIIPELLEPLIDVPYVPSSPSGGEPPIRPDVGVAHYFGIGAYMRPLNDARLAGVRFAAECLSFANPPELETVTEVFGSASVAGHDPRWKAAVAHDAGTSWDFEDVRDHYVRELFGVDPLGVRYGDPDHALDLGRATVVEVMERVLGDWRDRSSGCAGAIVLAWGDLWPGAGWGVVDAFGRPKAPYFALARAFAPLAVRLRDRGLSGLSIDVFNDRPEPLRATLDLRIQGPSGAVVESARQDVELDGRSQLTLEAGQLLGGFRDLTAAYRFSPLGYDVVSALLTGRDGEMLGRCHHLPGGIARSREPDVGLRAVASEAGERWLLEVSAARFAQFVSIDAPGFIPSDSWFHVPAGDTVHVSLRGAQGAPAGTVRALNSLTTTRIAIES